MGHDPVTDVPLCEHGDDAEACQLAHPPKASATFNPAYRVARCGQLSVHAPHVVESGPDQPAQLPRLRPAHHGYPSESLGRWPLMFGGFRRAATEPIVRPRELSDTDLAVAEELHAINILLQGWVGRPKNWRLVNALLDERLAIRPPDVMASRPAVPVIPGRPS